MLSYYLLFYIIYNFQWTHKVLTTTNFAIKKLELTFLLRICSTNRTQNKRNFLFEDLLDKSLKGLCNCRGGFKGKLSS